MLGDLIERWRVQAMQTLQGWATEKRTLRGIPVTLINTRSDIRSEMVFQRLDTALGLIQQHRPDTFAQISRDFSRIHVVRYPCRAAFYHDSRICLIELTFTVNPEFTEAQVASRDMTEPRSLYPSIEPYETGMLDVGDGHNIYYERCGTPGAKPAVFARWVFDLLGAAPGDALDDLFPGSGAITRAWATFCGRPR